MCFSKLSLVALSQKKIVHVHSQFSSELNYFVGSMSVSSKTQLPSSEGEKSYKIGFVELK